METRTPAQRRGLPPRPFLYTVDQLSVILQLSETILHQQYLYHQGRDVGIKQKWHMETVNISPPDSKPEWRVRETELIRWMKHKGFKFYDRGTHTR